MAACWRGSVAPNSRPKSAVAICRSCASCCAWVEAGRDAAFGSTCAGGRSCAATMPDVRSVCGPQAIARQCLSPLTPRAAPFTRPYMTVSILRIATRKSALALWQAEHVAAELRAAHPGLRVELVPMSTRGDEILDKPLSTIGGKGLFLKELEVAMLEGRADLA